MGWGDVSFLKTDSARGPGDTLIMYQASPKTGEDSQGNSQNAGGEPDGALPDGKHDKNMEKAGDKGNHAGKGNHEGKGKGRKGSGKGKGTPKSTEKSKEEQQLGMLFNRSKALKSRADSAQSQCAEVTEAISSRDAWSWAAPQAPNLKALKSALDAAKNVSGFWVTWGSCPSGAFMTWCKKKFLRRMPSRSSARLTGLST